MQYFTNYTLATSDGINNLLLKLIMRYLLGLLIENNKIILIKLLFRHHAPGLSLSLAASRELLEIFKTGQTGYEDIQNWSNWLWRYSKPVKLVMKIFKTGQTGYEDIQNLSNWLWRYAKPVKLVRMYSKPVIMVLRLFKASLTVL